MSSSTLEKWVVCHRPKPDASIRLFCAAWAGGSASVFNKWPSSLPQEVELHALRLPGRMSRAKEECLTSVPAIVEGAAKAMVSLGLLDKPFALFGHSFGSIVMFELARTLTRQGGANLRYLIVAGCRPPNMCGVQLRSPMVSKLPRDALLDHLIDLGGMPAELRDQVELVDYFLPAIRSDYTALECYSYEEQPGQRAITCPIDCFGGNADSGTPRSDLEQWASFTRGRFRLSMFEGGHFFLKDEGQPAVLSHLSEILTQS